MGVRSAASGLLAVVLLAACTSSPHLVTTNSAGPPAASSQPSPATSPSGRAVPVGAGGEPAGWSMLGVDGRVVHELAGFEDRRFEALPEMVFLVVTVTLEKLRAGPLNVPTTGVELRGGGRVRTPDGFGEEGQFCVHCRYRNRTTSRQVNLAFVFEIPRREASTKHTLVFDRNG